MDTRREFLKKAALVSAATGISNIVPASIQRALAIDPETGSTYLDAEHVVILMQENRSFDHCFGALRGVRGFNDPRAITLPDKNLVWMQSNKAGDTYAPFRFDIKDTKITWMGDVPHSRSSQVDANNLGKYDQWIEAKRSRNRRYADMPLTMGHYTREDIPFNYALADAFTLCDQHFCSGMTSTWPNRLYMWGGTIRGEKNGNAKAYIRNTIPWGEAHWEIFPERLQENDISWKVYQNDISAGGGFKGEERAWLSNFGCNQMEFLTQYNVKFSPRYVQSLKDRAVALTTEISKLQDQLASIDPVEDAFEKLQRDIEKKKQILQQTNEEIEQWSPENFEKLSPYQKELYDRAFTTNKDDPDYHTLEVLKYEEDGKERELLAPKGDFLFQFRKDVDSGNLPTVSWLVPSQNFSDHPSAPWYGAWLTSEILDILTKNPEVWKKTIFILTYDENDGYFDHIPPFVAPDPKDARTGKCSPGVNTTGVEYIRRGQEIEEGIDENEARGGPIGLGFRVPMIIASPWSRGGKVCSQVFDHTSILQFLEDFLNKKFKKNIREENISEWRRTVCGNLTSAFTRYDGNEKDKLSFFLSRDPFLEKIYNAKFKEEPSNFGKLSDQKIKEINEKGFQLMNLQEEGAKPSNPVPYELYVDGALGADKKHFVLHMQAQNRVFGNNAAGSPFIVYAPGAYVTLESEHSENKKFEPVRAWHYAVKAGDILSDRYSLNNFQEDGYHLRVYGPNGFFREFAGDEDDPLLDIKFNYQHSRISKSRLTGNVELNIFNPAGRANTIEIVDNGYKNKPVTKTIASGSNETIVLNLQKHFGWYDFSVQVKGNNKFKQRYAGRVETGKEAITDPVMGKTLS